MCGTHTGFHDPLPEHGRVGESTIAQELLQHKINMYVCIFSTHTELHDVFPQGRVRASSHVCMYVWYTHRIL